jgi:CRP/FNR family cyclic AMP-dependent transcriptional regulator
VTAAADLAAIPLFRGLSDAQLASVAAVLVRSRAPQGGEILTEGDPGRSLFVLVDGAVETSKHLGVIGLDGATPRQKVLVKLTAPQFFGEIGLLEDTSRSATVRASTACELLELRREDFERLVASDIHLGYTLMRNIAVALIGRLRGTDRDILKLTAALSIALGNR